MSGDEAIAALAERVARLSPAKRAMLEQALLDRQRMAAPARRIARRQSDGPAPLSFAQQGLWFLDQLQPGSAMSSATAAVRLTGPLDLSALRRAFAAVTVRHDVLRTTFASAEGGPVQLVSPHWSMTIPVVDLGALPAAGREAAAGSLVVAMSRRPFDLVKGPLFRVVLLALGDADTVLVLSLHHIVADGWSHALLTREVSARYTALTTGQAPALPHLQLQFADYAAWQARNVKEDDLRAQLEWWKTELAGSAPLQNLPADRARPAVPSYRAGSLDIGIPDGVAAALRAVSQRAGATLFMTLLAALQVLIGRYTGQRDVIVGTPVAGRNSSDLEDLIGCFVNTLALRTDLSGNPAFTELLRRVRDRVLAAYARQDVPFERLVEELRVERSASHAPVFQVRLVLQNMPPAQWKLSGVTVRPLRVIVPSIQVDVAVEIVDTGGALSGTLDYSTDLFDPATAGRFAGQFGTLLAGIARAPERRIDDLPVLSPAEETQILTAWSTSGTVSGPVTGSPADPVRLFEAAAERTPNAIAVANAQESLRYAELNDRANQVAQLLIGRGIGQETRVGICGEWSPDLVAAVLGVLKAGGAFVPMDPEHPRDRLAYLRADAEVGIVLTQERWRDRHGSAEVICLDSERDLLARQPRRNPGQAASSQNLAYVIYTSGSTGRPEGVGVTRGNLASYCTAIRATLGASAPDGASEQLSFGFLGALGTDLGHTAIFPALLHGDRLILVPRECALDGRAFAAVAARRRLDVLKTTPTQIRALLASAPPAQVLPARWLILGGEPLPRPLWDELASAGRCRLLNHYGPAEVTVGCVTSQQESADHVPGAATMPIGRSLPGIRAYVLDPGLRPVPAGVPGELCLAGAQVARGYLGNPGLTAERFTPDPFSDLGGRLYRTGDLARWTAGGVLEFLGRGDQQVKVRGHRIELGEIEATLAEHRQVTAVAVTVWQPDTAGARLVAHVVGDVAAGELLTFAAARLPAHLVPAAVVPLAAMPLTVNGKLDRAALALTAASPRGERESEQPGGAIHSQGPAAELLHAIWREVLGIDRIEPDTNFFASGGHSLLAFQVVTRASRTFGVELPVRAVFEAPTLAAFARRIEAGRRAGTNLLPAIRPADRGDPIPLSQAQQRLWYVDQLDRTGSAHIQSYALNVDGELSVPALAAAVADLRGRHESLRTTFRQDRDGLEQVVAADVAVPTPLIDLCAIPDREAQAQRLAETNARRPFDLRRGPLLRVTIVRRSESQHVLLVAMHHIITDAWSVAVLFDELWQCYTARAGDAPPRLPALPIQYRDYASWERRWLDDETALDKAASYWREQLAGAPEYLDLHYDRPLPATSPFRSATAAYELPAAESREIIEYSLREGATPFITVLAAYLILLRQRTGQSDIVVGAGTANRGQLETERVLGFFTNQLVLRVHVSGDQTVRELLARVREVTLSAYAHGEMPFNRLVRMLRPDRHVNRAPLFQVEIEFHRLTDTPAGPPGLTVARREVRGPDLLTTLDLSLHVVQTETVLRGGLAYNADVFSPATARGMVAQLRAILAVMVATSDVSTDELAAEAENQGRLTSARERATAARAKFDAMIARSGNE